jgi:hypothetical protein
MNDEPAANTPTSASFSFGGSSRGILELAPSGNRAPQEPPTADDKSDEQLPDSFIQGRTE